MFLSTHHQLSYQVSFHCPPNRINMLMLQVLSSFRYISFCVLYGDSETNALLFAERLVYVKKLYSTFQYLPPFCFNFQKVHDVKTTKWCNQMFFLFLSFPFCSFLPARFSPHRWNASVRCHSESGAALMTYGWLTSFPINLRRCDSVQ